MPAFRGKIAFFRYFCSGSKTIFRTSAKITVCLSSGSRDLNENVYFSVKKNIRKSTYLGIESGFKYKRHKPLISSGQKSYFRKTNLYGVFDRGFRATFLYTFDPYFFDTYLLPYSPFLTVSISPTTVVPTSKNVL